MLVVAAWVNQMHFIRQANFLKHNRHFELIAIKSGIPPTPLYEGEREAFEEFIMENFDPPLEIDVGAKILLSCDRKVEGMAVLTLRY